MRTRITEYPSLLVKYAHTACNMESEARPMTIKERMALLDQEKKKAAAVQTSAAPSDLPPTTGKLNVKGFLSNSGVREVLYSALCCA
jgi:hypothetical protein